MQEQTKSPDWLIIASPEHMRVARQVSKQAERLGVAVDVRRLDPRLATMRPDSTAARFLFLIDVPPDLEHAQQFLKAADESLERELHAVLVDQRWSGPAFKIASQIASAARWNWHVLDGANDSKVVGLLISLLGSAPHRPVADATGQFPMLTAQGTGVVRPPEPDATWTEDLLRGIYSLALARELPYSSLQQLQPEDIPHINQGSQSLEPPALWLAWAREKLGIEATDNRKAR